MSDRAGGFGLDLDGKPVLTPAKAPFVAPTRAIAETLAAEWRAQTDWIDPDAMPMTRLVNTATDGVAKALDGTIDEVAKFAETDLVCYRAGEPERLVAAQSAAWDPVLAFARRDLAARFICSQGIVFVPQPAEAGTAVRAAVRSIAEGPAGPLRLAALSVMTSLTGSVLLALAVANGAMSAEAAWTAAHVDEDHEMGIWGLDAEALSRRSRRWTEMQTAAVVL